MSTQKKSHSKDNKSLNEWLCYLETIHTTEIELGLTRIGQVAKRLLIDFSFAQVITVAGTNGKGTTCAFLENALLNQTVSQTRVEAFDNIPPVNVAVYSSPHIEHFNERLRINKCNIDDQSLINAFEKIEIARGDISLSYYEYTTLAAFLVLMAIKPEVIILEVGLGGRLDATNIINADVAVITTIDIDHQAFLGNDRETIGFEKAGIMRGDQHIIIGDPNPPQSVLNYANKVNERDNNQDAAYKKIKVRNRDFFKNTEPSCQSQQSSTWQWKYREVGDDGHEIEFYLNDLNNTKIPQDNVVTALMVLKQLGVKLTTKNVNAMITQTQVAGRTELFKADELNKNTSNEHKISHYKLNSDVMLDVGHNPHAGRYLAAKLTQFKSLNEYQRIIAVVGMLADKDIANTLSPFKGIISDWYVASLSVPRAASSDLMADELSRFTKSINCFDNITQAFKMANLKAESTDLILVFGSFYTVAEIRQLII